MFDNLLSNALKYSPLGSNIRIILQYAGKNDDAETSPQVRIQVNDQGPGIPEAYRESIFNKYEIIDFNQNDIPQIGLGLALCKKVVNAHNGRIYVKNNHPSGSRFIIEIV